MYRLSGRVDYEYRRVILFIMNIKEIFEHNKYSISAMVCHYCRNAIDFYVIL